MTQDSTTQQCSWTDFGLLSRPHGVQNPWSSQAPLLTFSGLRHPHAGTFNNHKSAKCSRPTKRPTLDGEQAATHRMAQTPHQSERAVHQHLPALRPIF